MKKKYAILFLIFLLTNCHTDNLSISLDTAQPLEAIPLFIKGSSNYIYELKVTDTHLVVLDQESDTILSAYEKNDYTTPIFSIKRDFPSQKILHKLHFSKEVSEKEQIILTNNNTCFYRLFTKDMNWELIQEGLSFSVINSFQYNRTQNEIYAVPFHSTQTYPFYYYNPTEGYYWVDADTTVQHQLSSDPNSYLCELCVNEKANKAVAAYRFANYITFYDLKGNIEKNIRIGSSPVVPQRLETGALDVKNTTKCILDVCGTPQYLYCLYTGSTDYAVSAYLIAFKWNGKHHKTWRLNKNIRTISVSNDNKTCYTVESLPDKVQMVSCYTLQ